MPFSVRLAFSILALAVIVFASAQELSYDVVRQRVDLKFTVDLRFPHGQQEFEVSLDCSDERSHVAPASMEGQLPETLGFERSDHRVYFRESPLQDDGQYELQFRCIDQTLIVYYNAQADRLEFHSLRLTGPGFPLSGLPRSDGAFLGFARRSDVTYGVYGPFLHHSYCTGLGCTIPYGVIRIWIDIPGLPSVLTVHEVLVAGLRDTDGNPQPVSTWHRSDFRYVGVVRDDVYYPLRFPNMHREWRNRSLSIPIGDAIDYFFSTGLDQADRWVHVRVNPRASAFFVRQANRPEFGEIGD